MLTGVDHPTGAVGVVISQIIQAGVVRIASRGEEEMNVIIALLVVTRGMWLGNGFFSKCNFYLQDEHSHYLQY